MPKIILHLRETILTNCRELLVTEGMDNMTMRSVAVKCHIAVGTLYNYFGSKEELIALVMLEDWNATLQKIDERIISAKKPIEAFRVIFEEVYDFVKLYGVAWALPSLSAEDIHFIKEKHCKLIEQLSEKTAFLNEKCKLKDFDVLNRAVISLVLAEASGDNDPSYDHIKPVIEKLFA